MSRTRTLITITSVTALVAGIALTNAGTVDAGPPAGTDLVFTVDTMNDTEDANTGDDLCADGDGNCSIRAAVEEANDDSANTLDLTIPAGTYPLEQPDSILVAVDATIHGAGAGATIIDRDGVRQTARRARAGNGCQRHFTVSTKGEGDLTIEDLALINGSCFEAGSIDVSPGASLTANRVHFEDNTAFDGHGGAILAGGRDNTVVINDSTFVGNDAPFGFGGAISVQNDTAVITNSTFTDNGAEKGGAIHVLRDGVVDAGASARRGNVGQLAPDVTLVHATISGNHVLASQRDVEVNNGEPTAGAIYVESGVASVEGSIIEDSTEKGLRAAAEGDPVDNCYVDSGTIVSGGDNVVDDDTCNATEAGDQENTAANAGALGDNGGPTHTMAIDQESAAFDAAGADCPDADQRGVSRPQFTACDSGAFEIEAPTPDPVTPTDPPAAKPAQAVNEEPDFTG